MQDADTKAVAAVIAAAKNMVWVTGAGLSVASGISPYRGDADAVWANFITEWGTIARFRQDPAAWYRAFWFKAHPSLRGDPDAVKPNAGHEAITALQKARAHKVITQNIDGLHRRSGAPAALTVEIHGRHDTYVCSDSNCSMGRTPLEGFSAADFDPEGHGGGTGGGDVDAIVGGEWASKGGAGVVEGIGAQGRQRTLGPTTGPTSIGQRWRRRRRRRRR